LKISKQLKKGGFCGAEIFENFEKIEKRGFESFENFEKIGKKRGGGFGAPLISKISKKIGKRGVFAAPKFSEISKNLASTKSAFWPIEQHGRGRG